MKNIILMTKMALFLSCVFIVGSCEAGECSLTPVHMTGVVNIRISKYGENYPVSRGDFHVTSSNTTAPFNCSFTAGNTTYRNTTNLAGATDSRGNYAQRLPDVGSDIKLGVEPSFTVENNPDSLVYPTTSSEKSYYIGDITPSIDVVTLDNGLVVPKGGSTTVVYTVPLPIAQASFGPQYSGNYQTPFYDLLYLDSLTVNYHVSSCGIKSKQGSDVTWPTLSKGDIVSGKVATMPYALSLICGKESDPPVPVNISFSATNGFANAANGIVKTNLESVGLKLSWANPALPPLILDQVNHSTLAGVGDYTVLAKPIKISSESNVISAGHLDTSVTMTVEFP